MRRLTAVMLAVTLLTPITVCSQTDQTPSVGIHVAALQGNVNVIRQHIEAGSDLNTRDAFGSTPLIIATTFGKAEVAKALIEAGADLEIMNNSGSTPLHIAAFLSRSEIVQTMLDHGANKYRRDFAGNTPFDIVAASFSSDKDIYDSPKCGALPPTIAV